jgi:hypothetical protein
MGQEDIAKVLQKFSMYPIERVARGALRGGSDDDDFDTSIVPFGIIDGLNIEDVSDLIAEDEFSIYREPLGTYAHDRFDKIKYALVHRYPQYEIDALSGNISFEDTLTERSRIFVKSAAACMRLIRPAMQHLQFFEGYINDDGKFHRIAFDEPIEPVMNPISHRTLAFRTVDAEKLKIYLPLFLKAMKGEYWKFRMAAQMHESGCFQNNDWRAKFFLWTTAVESLFTTQSPTGENSGSLVATERIKSFLGPKTSIYPPDELSSVFANPNICIEDIVRELYCLRNHIAHGDRIPDYYFQQGGRQDIWQGDISNYDVLLETVSFVIRHSLLKILRDNLLEKFASTSESESYFKAQGLTKSALKKSGASQPPCPQ